MFTLKSLAVASKAPATFPSPRQRSEWWGGDLADAMLRMPRIAQLAALAAALLVAFASPAARADSPHLGKPVTDNDIKAWEMTILPDGTGLPPGRLKKATLLEIIQARKTGVRTQNPEEFAAQIMGAVRQGKGLTMVVDRLDGRTIRSVSQPMPDGGWVATLEDITEWQKAQAQIFHMARHDAITNLPNRTLFRERLEAALQRVGRGERVGVSGHDRCPQWLGRVPDRNVGGGCVAEDGVPGDVVRCREAQRDTAC